MKWRDKLKIWKCFGIYHIKTIETYCVSCKNKTADKNSSVTRTKCNRLMLLSNFAICDKENQDSLKIKRHTRS